MARERVKDFDANEFIESVRESAVPTYHAAKIEAEAHAKDKANPSPLEVIGDYAVEVSVEERYADLKLTMEEIEFIKTFIVNPNFRKVNQKGKQIVIREQHRQTIQNILNLVNEEANMATYIDNVLTEHFKKYYPTIKGIYQKCPPKF